MVDDTELLEAWRGGDRAAGEVLCQRYFKLVQRFFYARRGGDVDDMVQQTFEACVKGRDRVREGSSFRAYVFGVAYNVMRVDRRQRRDTVPVVEEGAGSVRSAAPGPTTWMGAREDAERLAQGLEQLPVDLRMVLELHYFEGLSALDIARLVVLPEGTVRSRLRRGRRQLRMAMGKPLPEDGPMKTEHDNTEHDNTEHDMAPLGQTFESETT
ncbi:MAG: RNA polymerase sigma factor [Myxococcota bacterium]